MPAVGKSRQEACRQEDKGEDTTGRRWEGVGGGGVARSASDALEGKWGVRAHQTQEMKGKESSGDPEGQEAKSGLASSGRVLDKSGETVLFLMKMSARVRIGLIGIRSARGIE